MMQIEKHISELLFDHDCVIIPAFGGFVCNYSSASIHIAKSQFHPPFKKISFNRNLKNNDGLLANKIVREENISYSEANNFISVYVEKLNKELNSNQRFDVKNIGIFYLGEESTIAFEQNESVNYLPESLGLSTFYSPVIKREPLEVKIKRTVKDIKIIPSKEKATTIIIKRRIPVMRYVAIAASVLIITSFIFVSVQTDLLKNVNIANLNPFSEKILPHYHSSTMKGGVSPFCRTEIALPEIKKENISNTLANDTMKYLNILLDGKIPVVVSLTEDKVIVKKTSNSKYQTANHFYVIGGAFAVPGNAEKFCKRLIKQGYEAAIIEKKLHFVSYGNYPTRQEALHAIEKIRVIQDDVWLMTN